MPGVHPLSRIRIAGVLAGALLLALVFAGCDSASDPEPMPSPTVQPSPTATVENGSALPLESFHYVAALSIREANPDGEPDDVVVSTEGDFQAPDRHAFTYTTQLGEATVQESVVIVDLLAWHRRGDEPWRAVNVADQQVTDLLSVAYSAIEPGFLGGPEFESVRENVRHLLATEETINGIPAHRYEVGVPGREFFESFLASPQLLEIVQDLNWQLWLARDGAWPVRLLATATVTPSLALLENLGLQAPTAWELRVDISRPNDPTLMVVEPAADG
jgi:hypothetical protein